jgi:alkylated DNA repair protein alkB family protein 6
MIHSNNPHLTMAPPVFEKITLTKAINEDNNAIDFLALLREEKKRARELRKQKKSEPTSAAAIPSSSCLIPHPSTTSCKPLPGWPQNSHPLRLSPFDREKTIVSNDPANIYYLPEAIDSLQAEELQNWLLTLPDGNDGLACWKTMTYGKRRVCMMEALEGPLLDIANQLVARGIFSSQEPPNHVLLNEYQPGQGILPHTDGPAYASRTATLSLKSDTLLNFTKRLRPEQVGVVDNSPKVQLLLEARSLVVFEEEAYLDYCHGIEMDTVQEYALKVCVNALVGTKVERGHRLSLTFRHKK